jgi:hypothetical protein
VIRGARDLKINSLGCIVLPVALFAGLMVSTAGMAIYPPITFVADPLICSGTIDYVSTSYSYRPGQQGVERTIYCVADGPKGARQDVTMKAIGVSFLIYSAVFFLILGFLVRPLLRRRYRQALESIRSQPAMGGIAGAPVDVQNILARVSEAMERGEANVVVRNAAIDPGDGAGDLAGRLAQLKQLHDQGLITAEDYETKKAELLSRL